jgi:predicted Zn-dependent protease
MQIRSRLFQTILVVVFGAGGMMVTGCASDRAVISQANQFHSGLEPAVMTDPKLTEYIQAVGDRIIDAAREMDQQSYGPDSHKSEDSSWMFSKEMQFHFVNSKTLNAFTTGGEHMYIYTELFEQCKTEDELAAVMAHEFAHIYGRHVHKGMNRQYAILGAAALAGGAGYAAGGSEHGGEYAGYAASAAMIGGQIFGMGFTRKDEAEADELGFEFYVRAGWDPDHFADFFQTMIDKGYDTDSDFMSDHPTLKSRVEIARERAADLPPQAKEWRRKPVADARQFAALQKRAARLGKKMPDDTSLENAQELLAAMPRSCLTPQEPEDQKEAQQDILKKMQESQAAQNNGK